MSKGEIRGFNAGTFYPKNDDPAFIKISRTDDCVTVELVDVGVDIVYKFSIPFDAKDGSEVPFEFDSLDENRKNKDKEF